MKCLWVIGLVFSVLQLSSARSVNRKGHVEEGSKSSQKHSCRLLELPLQENLDLKRFEGKWYGTFKTGIGDSLLSYFTEIYDTRVSFKINTEGGFDMNAVGSKFYGGWCPKGRGKAVIPDKDYPERMTMFFDTTIGRKIGMKPGWILRTDYTNYAIIYSCWKIQSNGQCDPANAYAAVIQRSTKPLPPNKQAEVENALKSACVDIRKLTPVNHYGYCTGHDGL